MTAAIILAAAFGGVATLLLTCAIAWLILGRWLEGRSLIVASVACAISAGLGRNSYMGPPNQEALAALIGAGTTVLFGLLIGKFWLARAEEELDG